MIPKKIHYIWLGKLSKPSSFALALESWKKYASDFEIHEWNESNIQEFDLPEYYHRAIQEKRWAFASDVLRFFILEKYGGFYFDIDQVLIKSIDSFLSDEFVICMYHERQDYFGFGLIGCSPHNRIAKDFVSYFKEYYLVNSEKVFEIVNAFGSNLILEQYKKDTTGIQLLTQDYFYPLTEADRTEHTYSYHLANTSWVPMYKKVLQKLPFYKSLKRILASILPKPLLRKIGFNVKYF